MTDNYQTARMNLDKLFTLLKKSKFRSGFKLKNKELTYLKDKKPDVIRKHAYDFIINRLAPASPENDGKQTPMKNHPVFVAQHATGTCCRKCLAKWHKIPAGQNLTESQVNYIVDVIMKWIRENAR